MPKTHKDYKHNPSNEDVVPLHTMRGGQVMRSAFGHLGMEFPPVPYTLYFNTDVGEASLISVDMSIYSRL